MLKFPPPSSKYNFLHSTGIVEPPSSPSGLYMIGHKDPYIIEAAGEYEIFAYFIFQQNIKSGINNNEIDVTFKNIMQNGKIIEYSFRIMKFEKSTDEKRQKNLLTNPENDFIDIYLPTIRFTISSNYQLLYEYLNILSRKHRMYSGGGGKDYESMVLEELRKLAKKKKLQGYSKLNKAKLIQLIKN